MGGSTAAFHGGASSGGPSGGSSSVIQHQSGKSSPALGTLVSGNSGGSIISASGVPLASGNLTATTTESGNLKISFEKQTTRVQQLQEQEAPPARRSRYAEAVRLEVSTPTDFIISYLLPVLARGFSLYLIVDLCFQILFKAFLLLCCSACVDCETS